MGNTFSEYNVKLGFLERRSHLVLHNLHFRAVSESFVTVLDLGGPAYVHAY